MNLIDTFVTPVIKQVSQAFPEVTFLVEKVEKNLALFKSELDQLV